MADEPSKGTSAPSASLALWAEDNDIPAADLAQAYGVGLKSTTLPDGTQDAARINEGRSPMYAPLLCSASS